MLTIRGRHDYFCRIDFDFCDSDDDDDDNDDYDDMLTVVVIMMAMMVLLMINHYDGHDCCDDGGGVGADDGDDDVDGDDDDVDKLNYSTVRTVCFVPGESHAFSLNSTRLIRTRVNVDNGYMFL